MAFFKYKGSAVHMLAIYNASKGLNESEPRRFTADEIEMLQDLRAAFKAEIGEYMGEVERLAREQNEIQRSHMQSPDTPKYMRAIKENADASEKLRDEYGNRVVSIVVGDKVHSHIKACVTSEKAWLAVNDEALDFSAECIKIVKEAKEYRSTKDALNEPEDEGVEPTPLRAKEETEASS